MVKKDYARIEKGINSLNIVIDLLEERTFGIGKMTKYPRRCQVGPMMNGPDQARSCESAQYLTDRLLLNAPLATLRSVLDGKIADLVASTVS